VVRTEMEDNRKLPPDGTQAFDEVVGDTLQQEIVSKRRNRRPIASPGQQPTIDDVMISVHPVTLI
jgi:hypothetical protein